MRIAIIGSGISGLSTAYFLGQKYQTVLYEANDYLGGHARTKTIQYDDESISVDTGFIVYNKKNYPYLTQLFNTLNIETVKSDMSFGITVNQGAFEWSGRNLAGVFAQKSNFIKPWFYKMLWDIQKFNTYATQFFINLTDEKLTLGAFLDNLKVSPAFLDYYLLPMAGAIWSCPPQKMREFPAKSFLTFFYNHGLLTITQQPQWYSVYGGSHNYIKKLHAAVQNCQTRLNCGVTSVTHSEKDIYVTDKTGNCEKYNKIVFACSTDVILDILQNPEPHEYNTLSKIKFQSNHIILHRDISQMPKRHSAWASWVYQSEKNHNKETQISVTYYMNRLQSFIPHNKPLFVTLNPVRPINTDLIFDDVYLKHPVFTHDTLIGQNQISALQGHNNCYYAGAWTGYGFHEDGIKSAVTIAKLLNIKNL